MACRRAHPRQQVQFQTLSAELSKTRGKSLLARFFAPAPASLPIPPEAVDREHERWQRQVLLWSIVGYATFYFLRKNLSVAMPVMEATLGISKKELGLFLTLHGLLYGISKFANGYLGDRCNGRAFMVVGLIASAAINIALGASSIVWAFGVLWMLNGWFQGMGFPPCARLMTHWFEPRVLATKMSIWNASHSIGAGLVVILCGYLVSVSWRLCFFVPAAISLLVALALWRALPDTPSSVGLPELQSTAPTADEAGMSSRDALFHLVLRNKYIWLLALANFFVYSVRYAVLDWGPTLLSQAKHVKLAHAGWMVAAFEISGIAGVLLAGWLTDRVFGGRGIRACLIYMCCASCAIVLFWKVAGTSTLANTGLLCAAGFFIYGPQGLVGIAAANLATKRAAATAIGFTGLFGYASTTLSGVGLGALVQAHGWDAGFVCITLASVAGAGLFALGWGAHAHGYNTGKAR